MNPQKARAIQSLLLHLGNAFASVIVLGYMILIVLYFWGPGDFGR